MAFWTPTDKPRFKKLKEEGCLHTLSVEVPAKKVEEAVHNAFIQIQARASLPGFRVGKAPLDLIQQQFREQARQKAFDQVIQQVIPEAFKELSLHPIAVPTIHTMDWQPGKPLTFQVSVECPPKFAVKDYKKVPVQKRSHPVTEADVDQNLNEIRQAHARLEIASEEQVSKNHFVVVDYEGTIGSKPIPGGKAESELVDMSAPQTIAGLAEGILNAKRGETRQIPVEINNQKAIFKVTVKEIKSKVVPALDAEFSKDLGFESLEELRKKVRETMEQEAQDKAKRELRKQIEDHLIQFNAFPVPNSLVEAQQEQMLQRLKSQSGNGPLPEKELENLKARLRGQAEREVRLSYILKAIAEEQNLRPGDADFEQELASNLQRVSSQDQEKLKKFLEDHKTEVLAMLRERKVLEHLEANARIREV